MVKICIFGGGAIGGYIAGHLARAGHCDVSMVARGDNLAAVRDHGLEVQTPSGSFVAHPRVTDDPATLGPQDAVLLTLKAHQLPSALPQLAPLIGPDTMILPPTTGIPAALLSSLGGQPVSASLLDPDGVQMRAMPPAQVLGIVYWIGAHSAAPGVVHQDGPVATCMLGELDGALSERAKALADCLTQSGIRTPVRPNIRGDIWIKFVNSLCWNPVAVLTGATNGTIGADSEALNSVAAMMREADAIAERIGLTITVPVEKRIGVTLSAPAHKMSMLQDFEAGRPLEIEILKQSIGAVKEMAGMPTPALDAVLSLMALRTAKH